MCVCMPSASKTHFSCGVYCCWYGLLCRTFVQFVCTLWSFFTLKQAEIGAFVFFMFDLNKSGEMPHSQITHMAKQIHKKHYDESPALKVLVANGVKTGKGDGGKCLPPLTADAFAAWSGANPDMCRPIVGKQVRGRAVAAVPAAAASSGCCCLLSPVPHAWNFVSFVAITNEVRLIFRPCGICVVWRAERHDGKSLQGQLLEKNIPEEI